MAIKKIIFLSVLIILLNLFLVSVILASTFDQKKAAWLARDGQHIAGGFALPPESELGKTGNCWLQRPFIFAWLENGTHKQCDSNVNTWDCQDHIIESFINQTGCPLSENADVFNAPFAARVYYQYGDKVSPSLRSKIGTALNEAIFNNRQAFSMGPYDNERTQQYISYVKYLVALDYKDANILYQPCDDPKDVNCHYQDFTDSGKTYRIGGTYNAYELMRAWLNAHWNYWLETQVSEMDSPVYSISNLVALITLYDFAGRPLGRLNGQPDMDGLEMKKRAKMMTDFYLLDNGLNFSGNQRGGVLGRPKAAYFKGTDEFPFYHYFDAPNTNGGNINADSVYASGYRMPQLIYDLVNLSNEPDNYWRLEREEKHNKMTYVTKYYTLGSWTGYDGWRMTIVPEDNPEQPFALWINDEYYVHDGNEGAWFGESGFQYKNFMLIENDTHCHTCYLGGAGNPEKLSLHIFKPEHTFDEGEENLRLTGGQYDTNYELVEPYRWNFFRDGKTMLAIKINNSGNKDYDAFLEAGILGVDYQNFDDFKKAVQNNVKFLANDWMRDTDGSFYIPLQNSKGEKMIKRMSGAFFGPDGKSPYARESRLEAEDNLGNKVVSWQGKVMTVSYNGLQCVYDFKNWTYSGNGCGDNNGGVVSEVEAVADINCDSKVDVQDFGILLSKWNQATNLANYLHNQCSSNRNLDLIADSKIDSSDIVKLFSCWGVFPGICQ